jgi:hypothetical protein
MQIFEYLGFSIHRIGLYRYFVTGPYFRDYATSVIEAVKIIDAFSPGNANNEPQGENMRILINLQPATKEEMFHFDAFSCVSMMSDARLFRLLNNARLLEPKYIKCKGTYNEAFWGIFNQHHWKGVAIDMGKLPGVCPSAGGSILLPSLSPPGQT